MNFVSKKKLVAGVFLFFFIIVVFLLPVMFDFNTQQYDIAYIEAQGAAGVVDTVANSESVRKIVSDNVDPVGFVNAALAWVMTAIMAFFALLVWASGLLLNVVAVETVVQMAALVKKIGVISEGWATFRDLANIVLVFLLLFIGIATILRLSGYGMKALLVRVIVIALLINFSLFFTNVIIDATNLLAAQFYSKIVSPEKTTGIVESVLKADEGIATRYMTALSLTSIYGFDPDTGLISDTPLTTDNIFTIGLMASLLFLVTAAVFFAAAIILIVRFVVLVFLMVLAPLAFVAMAIPNMGSYASRWWRTLINHAAFAPLFFLLTWFVLKVVESDGFRTSIGLPPLDPLGSRAGPAFSGVTAGDPNSLLIVVNFLILMAFAVGSLVIARQMSVWGAATATGWAQRGARLTLSAAGRPFHPLGRAAWRRAAGALGDIEGAKEDTRLGRTIQKVLDFPLGGRQLRRGLQRGRASYTTEVYRRQKELETLRDAELDRRRRSSSGFDFTANVLEKHRRGNLDEVSVEDIAKAKNLMRQGGMGLRSLRVNRPDAGIGKGGAEDFETLKKEIITSVTQQNPTDVNQMHRRMPVEIYNDDGKVKYGDEVLAKKLRRVLLGAWFERWDGENTKALLSRGGLNRTKYMEYGAELVGTDITDQQLLPKMAEKLEEINHMRRTGTNREGVATEEALRHKREADLTRGLIERSESTIRELQSVAAHRAAGMVVDIQGGGGEQERKRTKGAQTGQDSGTKTFQTEEEKRLAEGLQKAVNEWRSSRQGGNST